MLRRLVEAYLLDRQALHVISALTARNQRCALYLFAGVVGARPLERLGRRDVERWLKAQAHLSDVTRRGRLSMLRQFSRWLVDRGHVRRDFTHGVPAPRQPRSADRSMPAASVGALLRACPDERARAIVWCMVGLGMRCCEVASFQLGDWNRAGEVVLVRGKGGHERLVAMTPEVAAALRGFLAVMPAGVGPIFRSYRNHARALTAGAISKLVSEWMDDAGIKGGPRDGVSAHALRHTAAADVLEACGDLRVVQEMLGHQRLETTAIYLPRAGLGRMRDAMSGRDYEGAEPAA